MTEEKDNWYPTDENIEEYELLRDMLKAQKDEFDLLSKKKADWQLNPMKIKMVNRVLEPLKDLLQYENSSKFLDILNEEDLPTNSDVVLIISQYDTAILAFRNDYYSSYEREWITEEFIAKRREEEEAEYYDQE